MNALLPIPGPGDLQQICKRRHSCPIRDEQRQRQYTEAAWEEALAPEQKIPVLPTYDKSWLSRQPEEPEPCYWCEAANARRRAVAEGRLPPFYVLATGCSRHYGGPEEGGWWYDHVEILEVRMAFTWKRGLKHARELRDKYPQPRYGIGSCANRGEPEVSIRTYYDESQFPEATHGRPRYE